MIARSVFLAGMAALGAWAQDQPAGIAMAMPAQGMFNVALPGAGADVMYIRTEVAGADKVVKGAPFSAEVVTEFTQVLADGNTIRRNQTGTLARDSAGRTRREQPMVPLGAAATPNAEPRLVFINDPVAGASYVLDTDKKTVQKLRLPKLEAEAQAMSARTIQGSVHGPDLPKFEAEAQAQAQTLPAGVLIAGNVSPTVEESRTETKTIEGVRSTGRRTTHTIPAGAIGNDRPIEMASERWYSPELQTVILSKHSDPRMGETVYRLTNINRAEPAPALFEIPADYTVVEGMMRDVKLKMEKRLEGTETK